MATKENTANVPLHTVSDETDAPARKAQSNGKNGVDLSLLITQAITKDDAVAVYKLATPLSRVSSADYAGYKSQLKAHFKQRLSVGDLDKAVKDARKNRKFAVIASRKKEEQERLTVEVGGQLREVVQSALDALVHADNAEPTLFVRGSELVTIHYTKADAPIIAGLCEQSLRLKMSHSADYISIHTTADDVVEVPVDPPLDIVRAILSGMNPRDYPFPSLAGITELPILRTDGSLYATPGYDAVTEQVYIPGNLVIPAIPDVPTDSDVQRAKDTLNFWLADFPFENEASRAAIIADAITVVIRSVVDGQVPLTLLDAPKQGSGKTILAQAIGILGTGRVPAPNAPVNDEEEWEKKILTWLQDSPAVVIIDNLVHPLESSTLNSTLTTPIKDGRRLGSNEHLTVVNRAIWFASGNNIRVGDDTARRCIKCRLDARVERPHLRDIKKFRIPGGVKGFFDWTMEHRADLVSAVLTLAKHWYAQGQPIPDVTPLGNFEAWTITIGGILQCASIPGFLENLNAEDGNSSIDEISAEWAAFIEAIHAVYQVEPFTCSDLTKRMLDKDDQSENLCETLPASLTKSFDSYKKSQGDNRDFANHLGYAFRTRKGQIHGDFCLEVAGMNRKRRAQWKVNVLTQDAQAEPVNPTFDVPLHTVACGMCNTTNWRLNELGKNECITCTDVKNWYTCFLATPDNGLRIREDGSFGISVPDEVSDEQYKDIETYVLQHDTLLRSLIA